MSKFKAALLDDNKEQLLLNQQMLESLGMVAVISSCTSAKAFLEDVKNTQPEILFLDLNLGDSYMTGMEVAFQLKLPVLFVSSNTAQYIKEIEKLKRNKNKGLILSKLQSALSSNIINEKDIKKILIEAEKHNWNVKEIRLPFGVEFIDKIYDTFYLDTDFSILLDNKLLMHNDEDSLELVNDNNQKINVSTLNEWKKALNDGFYPLTTYAIKSSSTFTFFEGLIEALEKAKMPKVSFISDPWLEIDMLDYLSPNILMDEEGELLEYIENKLSIGDLVRKGIVKINDSYIYKISLEFGGFETSLIEQFRADFNDDGIEDIFVRGWTRATMGTMGFGFTTILTKLSEKHLIEKEL